MKKALISLQIISVCLFASEFNPQMSQYITELKKEVQSVDKNFIDFDISRGEKIFTSKHIGKKGVEISCVSCHGLNLSEKGKNTSTNKLIEPLSPKANPQRLTDVKDVQKWLRRNFQDVYVREGSAQEKGDVLYYIMSK